MTIRADILFAEIKQTAATKFEITQNGRLPDSNVHQSQQPIDYRTTQTIDPCRCL